MSKSRLFQDPEITYPIDDLNLPFQEYITQCRNLIETTRVDLATSLHPELIIDANAPFDWEPKQLGITNRRYGALLIHGLLDSPYVMRDVGRKLQAQGYHVRSILLPGHGTVPGALLNVRYQDWLQAMHYGIHSLAREVDRLFIVGFSTGASLGLYHAMKNLPNSVAGLILLAPAIKIFSSLDFLSNAHRCISWALPRAKWLHIATEDDYVKYQSMPFNAAYQVYQLTQDIKKMHSAQPIAYPLLVALSEKDRTVSSQATIAYFQEHTHHDSRMIVYTNHPENYHDSRLITRKATYPQWHIRDVSHVSIPIEPNNPHYGLHGDYPRASHAETPAPDGRKIIYGTYNNAEYLVMNMLFKMGWVNVFHERLTFNPDFEFLTQTMEQFMEHVILSSKVHHIPT